MTSGCGRVTLTSRSAGVAAFSGLPTGHYRIQAECQAALHDQSDQWISQLRQMAVVTRGLSINVIDRQNYIATEERTGPGPFSIGKRAEPLCYLKLESES
jgi:hypothetical protein